MVVNWTLYLTGKEIGRNVSVETRDLSSFCMDEESFSITEMTGHPLKTAAQCHAKRSLKSWAVVIPTHPSFFWYDTAFDLPRQIWAICVMKTH